MTSSARLARGRRRTPTIIADNDCCGQVRVIQTLLESADYREFWQSVDGTVLYFESLELPTTAPDAAVWQACQERQLILVTGNRNADAPDSLEVTRRAWNDPSCLPVITIASPRRLIESKAYAVRAVERLLDYLMDLDRYRGAGRLYIP